MSEPDVTSATGPLHPEEARALFEREVPTIEALARSLCRRYGMDADEADGFVSWVMVRILEDDVAVLRKFAGRSSLRTYLAVVVANLYRDHRIQRFGRWRPSAAARRLGGTGVLLDAYLNRKGHPLEEAVQLLLSREDVEEDEATLRAYAARIPRRERRTFTSDSLAQQLPSDEKADQPMLADEDEALFGDTRSALERALEALPDQDQVIVRMHYWEGLTLAAIARALGIEQKPLYRRMEANLRRLRASLEEQGVEREDVSELLPI